MGTHVIFAYPLVLHALRNNLEMLFFPLQNEGVMSVQEEVDKHDRKRQKIAIGLVVVLLTISYLVPSIGVVIAFNGSTFGVMVVYVIPAALYLRIESQKRNLTLGGQYPYANLGGGDVTDVQEMQVREEEPEWLRPASYLLAGTGICFGLIGVVLNAKKYFT